MPAAHDIYADQLRELRRGQALYYPEPSPDEGAVEIGDVGYTRQGAFCRLFNVSRSADDPAQTLGVPEGFQPLNMGRIRNFEAALEPGPLHSKTIFRVNADIGSSTVVLPAEASFRFSCTSSRGAILMLESQMKRDQALHDQLFKAYLLHHCLSWYKFASDIGVQVDFGDVMLVTECSKTAAWASAVYSQSSKEFGMSFSAGGAFLPSSPGGVALSASHERIGPVEYRRSQTRAITPDDALELPKDHTVFIKAYRLGPRSLYLRSLAHKIMKTKGRTRQEDRDRDDSQDVSLSKGDDGSPGPSSSSRASQPSDGSSELVESVNGVSSLTPEWPDLHPATALLAHVMETSKVEIAVVHDNDWCLTYNAETSRTIDEYAQCFFNEDFLAYEERSEFEHAGLSERSIFKSIMTSEEAAQAGLLNKKATGSAAELSTGPGISERGLTKIPMSPNPCISNEPTTPNTKNTPPTVSIKDAIPAVQAPTLPVKDGKRLSQKKASIASAMDSRKTVPSANLIKDSVPAPTPPSPLTDDMPKKSSPESGMKWGSMDSWRIALLGDGGVGKTALAVQFTLNCFIESHVPLQTYDPTVEDAYRKQAPIDQRMCFIEVIDTAGQEEYASLREQWAREGQAFALVFSVASRATFERLEIFRQLMLRVKRHPPCFVLVGNKVDKSYEREVSKEEGEGLAEQFGCEYLEASAKTGKSVDELFFNLVRKLRTPSGKRMPPGQGIRTTGKERKHKSCIVM